MDDSTGSFEDRSIASSFEDRSAVSESDENEERLAQEETKVVLRLRVLVILLLLCAAAAVSIGVYYITKASEDKEFETSYEGNAAKVVSSFIGIVDQKLAAIGSLGIAYTAFAESQNLTWPFVTVNSYQQRVSSVRKLSSALYFGFCPIVQEEDRLKWEEYSVQNAGWIEEGRAYQEEIGIQHLFGGKVETLPQSALEADEFAWNPFGISNKIWRFTETFEAISDPGPAPYSPTWLASPIVKQTSSNINLQTFPAYSKGSAIVQKSKQIYIGSFNSAPVGDVDHEHPNTAFFAAILTAAAGKPTIYNGDPMSDVYFPVFDSKQRMVGWFTVVLNWKSYFEQILPSNAKGVFAVLKNSCGEAFTYQIDGAEVQPLGFGDLHDDIYNHLKREASFEDLPPVQDGSQFGLEIHNDDCTYSINVYPSDTMKGDFETNTPLFISVSVAFLLVFTAIMFVVYDRLVERRQRLVLTRAERTTAIVSSLFPKAFRDRLIQEDDGGTGESALVAPSHRLKSFLSDGTEKNKDSGNKPIPGVMAPIADMFPHTTVLFADISGFTAWSSTRDPSQVFVLLQTVFRTFDIIAKRLRVFKVETVGDSYVACTGLPNPQSTHAVVLARFASMILTKFKKLIQELDSTLGPDTSSLGLRIGMHSGPVTAGVLRGERSRFQIFGDTVNTAARMESTGIASKIQCSNATAQLLTIAGKDHWLERREDSIVAKGKGVLTSFWVKPKKERTSSMNSSSPSQSSDVSFERLDERFSSKLSKKHERLVDWVVELLKDRIQSVMILRQSCGKGKQKSKSLALEVATAAMPLDEVAEIIVLPDFDCSTAKAGSVQLSDEVLGQLRKFVTNIAAMYHSNAFHNFEHACHVTMAVDKFLKRISAPDLDLSEIGDAAYGTLASHLHDYTHGITSDPLTLVAIVISALIHDSDHRGVSNAQLGKEEEQMAMAYKNKSIAEQNSLDLAWNLLMKDDFFALRACLFGNNQDELKRFRQVMVNVVLATDIFDKELNDLRKNRWNKAFDPSSTEDTKGLRATIVIEHIIQASDVSHTMQHWIVYRKWNKALFTEMYTAWKVGRMGVDPSTFWYKGELGFFDNYIIPLAKKLKECNVFGVSSDECLNYALRNRAEWEEFGEQILASMMEEINTQKSIEL